MRKNFLQVAGAVALSLTVALAGCSREEGIANSEPRTVLLKIALPKVATRAEAEALSGTEAFQPGWLFFTNAGGSITRALEITDDGDYNDESDGDEVGVEQLEEGIEIVNVPGTSTFVHVISNLPEGVDDDWNADDAVGDNISTYAGAAITVESQYNESDGDGSAVTLYGTGEIVPVQDGEEDEFKADVALDPVAGRVEIAKISADADEITSFNVTGVYVNYYYPDLAINGTVGSSVITNNGSDPANYSGDQDAAYEDLEGILFDEDTYESDEDLLSAAPASGVWAYNLLAPALGSDEQYFPHIVIKIEDIEVESDGDVAFEGKTWFLVIANVKESDEGDNLPFLKGTVYRIANVPFTLDDLADRPELDKKRVTVTVSVNSWTGKDVLPVLQ
jgi:hypothetical protein